MTVQHWNTFRKLTSALSTVHDIAYETKRYTFTLTEPATFYLDAEQSEVNLRRWDKPIIQVDVRLQAGFGWRVLAEQDEAGVYVIAKRRPIVGTVSSGLFSVALPVDVDIVLKLNQGTVQLNDVSGMIEIPASSTDDQSTVIRSLSDPDNS